MSRINVIKGKPSLSASLMAALVERAYGPKALIVEEATNDHCTVSVWKPGWDKRRTITFSMADAKQAGIVNQMYQKYPRAMLRSRAISEACETHFQSIVGGLYTPEELGADPAEEDIIGDTPAVQTEVAAEGEWIPVEDGGADRGAEASTEGAEGTRRLDRETGEIIDGEAREVEGGVDPELIAHFNAILRDLNKITGKDASSIFEDMEDPKIKLQRVKKLLLNALKHAIEKCESGAELDELKAEWGDHPAWTQKVQERWGARYEKVTGIPVDELEEAPF